MPPRARKSTIPATPREQPPATDPPTEQPPIPPDAAALQGDPGANAPDADRLPADPPGPDEPEQPPLCGDCFPAGWPDDAYSAGCEHGSYLHGQRAAAIGG